MSRQKEEFVPIQPGKVSIYACGPTVYNFIHVGNARPIILFDVLRRYFEYRGYDVTFVQNFTDVDDKIIKKAMEEGVDASEISERYIKECQKDMADLNVKEATHHPKATEEIPDMIEMVKTLIEKGYAYEGRGIGTWSAMQMVNPLQNVVTYRYQMVTMYAAVSAAALVLIYIWHRRRDIL